MSTECKKCGSKVNPIEIKSPAGNYSSFVCPVCNANIPSGRYKELLSLIAIGLIAWLILYVYHQVK